MPDKYQAKVTYQAVNGAVTLGGRTGTELVTYVTLFDADGKWAENGTGKLAEAQVPTAPQPRITTRPPNAGHRPYRPKGLRSRLTALSLQ